MIKLEWEEIDQYHSRAKVFGGWIVKTRDLCVKENGELDSRFTTCFVPDPKHEWGEENKYQYKKEVDFVETPTSENDKILAPLYTIKYVMLISDVYYAVDIYNPSGLHLKKGMIIKVRHKTGDDFSNIIDCYNGGEYLSVPNDLLREQWSSGDES